MRERLMFPTHHTRLPPTPPQPMQYMRPLGYGPVASQLAPSASRTAVKFLAVLIAELFDCQVILTPSPPHPPTPPAGLQVPSSSTWVVHLGRIICRQRAIPGPTAIWMLLCMQLSMERRRVQLPLLLLKLQLQQCDMSHSAA